MADGGSSYERDLCHVDSSDSRTFAILTIRFLSLFLTCKKIPRSGGGGGGGRERAFKGTSGPPPNYTTTHIHVLLMVSTLLNEISIP